ncbi:unnamed protein product, partial [Dovyalis caffra]
MEKVINFLTDKGRGDHFNHVRQIFGPDSLGFSNEDRLSVHPSVGCLTHDYRAKKRKSRSIEYTIGFGQ